MKRCFWISCLLVVCVSVQGQSFYEKIDKAVQRLVADSQMKHGILGLYIADAITGELIYEHNGKTGLAPASTQKIVTSVAALDLLGKDFTYKTEFGYTGKSIKGLLTGNLIIKGSGDPTFGSSRYVSTKPATVFSNFITEFNRLQVRKITGEIYIHVSPFTFQPLPGGWIWDDIGNYYGAGSWGLNWRENQYDLLLQPGKKEGDPVVILGTDPKIDKLKLLNYLTTGKKGSGDNAYIYQPPYSDMGFVDGTFEGGKKISGSMPDAPAQFEAELKEILREKNILADKKISVEYKDTSTANVFFTHYSPAMDSIIYWFMRRSINLYGEALIKTIGVQKSTVGSTDSGLAVIERFYREKNIATSAELKIIDGSGLSPSNRVTSELLGKILVYAKKQAWFPAFEHSFPVFNNMKLKSGTIRGAKAFAGYHTSLDGKEYVVAIIVNNYDGPAGSIVNKMYKVLDALK